MYHNEYPMFAFVENKIVYREFNVVDDNGQVSRPSMNIMNKYKT